MVRTKALQALNAGFESPYRYHRCEALITLVAIPAAVLGEADLGWNED